MANYLQWFATAATVLAATVTAANLGARITGYGFGIFLAGSLAWLATGILTGQTALTATNAILSILNLFGMWRWLGRQAKVEEGAQDAATASRQRPGDTLFPLSLLTRAPVIASGEQLGHCVDGMAGCASGRIEYVVFSDGGIAGVGETLRRIDWKDVIVAGEEIRASLPRGIAALETVGRDRWPAA